MNINNIDDNRIMPNVSGKEVISPANMTRSSKEVTAAAASFVRDDGRNGMFGAYSETHSAMIPEGGSEADAKNRKNMMTVLSNTVSPEAFAKMSE